MREEPTGLALVLGHLRSRQREQLSNKVIVDPEAQEVTPC